MVRNRYRAVVLGRRVTKIGQLTTFFGTTRPDGSIHFANALFTSKRFMPFMGPGPRIYIHPRWEGRLMVEGTMATMETEDGEGIDLVFTGRRQELSNLFRFHSEERFTVGRR